jgi:hypothetical protein
VLGSKPCGGALHHHVVDVAMDGASCSERTRVRTEAQAHDI